MVEKRVDMTIKNFFIVIFLIFGFGLINYLISKNNLLLKIEKHIDTNNKISNTSKLNKIPCTKEIITNITEGPYYSSNSPLNNDFIEKDMSGEIIELTGFVLNKDCLPLQNVWLDFWQADSQGIYDNEGYTLRGHQFTNNEGKYSLKTIIPGEYPGRTPHIHVKIRLNENKPILTTQLFFPEVNLNNSDSLYDKALEVSWNKDKKTAQYNFIIED